MKHRPLSQAILASLMLSPIVVNAQQINLGALSGADGFALIGPDVFDTRVGATVSGAGDINGDGIADLLTTSKPVEGFSSGYLVLGNPGADVDLTNSGFTFTGDSPYDDAGRSATAIGDFNGDGFDDYAFGAPGVDSLISDPFQGSEYYERGGAVYIVFGSATPGNVTASTADVEILGENGYDEAGRSVSGAGDVNGDGFDDIVISAPEYYDGLGGRGRAYVVFGSANPTGFNLSGISSRGFRISPDMSGIGSLRTQVSGAGDFNGDGLDDIALTEYYSSSVRASVVFGKTDGSTVVLTTPASNRLVIDGASLNYAAIAGAGDVNGDGFADVVIGAPGASRQTPSYGFYSGAGHVVFGASGSGTVSVDSLGSRGFSVFGANDYDRLGVSAAGAGDLNGDGLGDIILGLPDPLLPPYDSGAAFVVFGKSSDTQVVVGTSMGNEGFALLGEEVNSRAGESVSAAGDVNGDGLADMMVGAPDIDRSAGETGKAYVVFSDQTAAASATFQTRSLNGDAPQEAFGIVGDQSNVAMPDGRFWIDFQDGTDELAAPASTDTVTLNRSAATFTGTPISGAGVFWEFASSRTGWNNAIATLKYTDGEIAGLDENFLGVYYADSASGPWTRAGSVNPFSNTALATLPGQPANTSRFLTLGVEPEIQFALGDSVPNNTTVPVGNADVTAPFNQTFTILNDGGALLTLGTISVANLSNVANFSLVGAQPMSVAPGFLEEIGFDIDVLANGPFSFDLVVPNNDADESPYVVTVQGNGINGVPEIDLTDFNTQALPDGGTANAGNIEVSGPVTRQFTLENLGQADLTLGTVTTSNLTNLSAANIANAPVSTLDAGAATIFEVEFDVDANGPFAFDVSIPNNDSDENPYTFTVSGNGTGGVPEIELSEVVHNGTDNVGDRPVAGPVARTYTVDNLGSSVLTLGTVTAENLTNVNNFSVTMPPATSVDAGSSSSFGVSFDPVENGPFSIDILLANDDSDESPYRVTVAGTGTGGAPDISISRDAMNFVDDGVDNLGERVIGNVELSYTVTNDGTAPLNITARSAGEFVNVSGFITTAASGNTLAPGESGVFAFRFRIAAAGNFGLSFTIESDDPDTAAFDIDVLGTGVDTQEFPELGGLMPGDMLGAAIAGSGNLYAVGIPGMNGDTGQVVIYRLDGAELVIDQVIDVPPGSSASEFGASLAMEGDRLLIGAPGTAPAQKGGLSVLQAALYQRINGQWQIKQTFPSDDPGGDDGFGSSVALSGNNMVIGAPGDDTMGTDAGAAYVFSVDTDGNNIVSFMTMMPPNATQSGGFGTSVAASANGKFAAGAPGGAPGGAIGSAISGSITMFDAIGNNLATVSGTQSSANDQFGTSVSMSGNMMVVGSPGQDGAEVNGGAAYVFNTGGNSLVELAQLNPFLPVANSGFGQAVTIAGGGFAIGAPLQANGAGAVYQYGSDYAQMLLLQALAGQSGFGSALAGDQINLLIGAPNTNAATGAAALQRDRSVVFASGFE